MLENSENNVLINDQKMEFTVFITNSDDKLIPIRKPAIERLSLEEDIHNWYHKGFIIINNQHEVLEKPLYIDSQPLESGTYQFRNDGRDRLYISVKPYLDTIASDELDPNLWELNFLFSIYDTQDIDANGTSGSKFKKLYFWEYEYQLLLEKKIEWSTNNLLETNTPPKFLSDDARKVFTGDAIRNLLIEGLQKSDRNVNFDDENWDKGEDKVFWSSPSTWSVDDNLNYLIDRHISETPPGEESSGYDNCLLRRHRFNKQWTLIPIKEYFERSTEKNIQNNITIPGEWQVEHFFISNTYEDRSVKASDLYKAPYLDFPTLSRDIKLPGWNQIASFQFVDMSGYDNMEGLVSRPVYSNDLKDKQFNAEFANHSIEEVEEFFTENYVDKLHGRGGVGPAPLLTFNQTKTNNLSLKPEYSTTSSEIGRLAKGRNKTLKSALYLNQAIVFTVKGMTHRQAGRFIAIDREAGSTGNNYDNKLLGQWFVTHVKHYFFGSAYVNEITAVKIHSYEDLNITRDIE